MKRFIAAAITAGCLVSFVPAWADGEDPGAFDKWLNPDAPECVPMSAIRSVAGVKELTREQFQFVRALYVSPFRRFPGRFLPAIARSWQVRAAP
jgi:hypothetical protein